ncbi:hypothetical protein R3P38DRAFT_3059073 [Favolaschia claudopus]|uniref:Uncharacterized protein n=1 Tax=Favolaschia claudopus TaxID=2862362 RepID=A0AAW0A3D4_9AGAR
MSTSLTEIEYYRFNVICYHVEPNALGKAAKKPLCAVLAHKALIHPNSPLNTDGAAGLSLFLGICPDGQQHLLFSSTQVDYGGTLLRPRHVGKILDCL